MPSGRSGCTKTGSWNAVPGALIDRNATPLMPGRNIPSPISQSASRAVWRRDHCFTSEPNTSAIDSLSAPDWSLYGSFPPTTPCVNSCPMTSASSVKRLKIIPSPSPNTICEPFQNALL